MVVHAYSRRDVHYVLSAYPYLHLVLTLHPECLKKTAQQRQQEPKLWYVELHFTAKLFIELAIIFKQLKKRQQKKAADSTSVAADSSVTSSATPPRTFSPAPSEPVETDGRDLGDVSVMLNKAAVMTKVLMLLQLF